MPSWTVIEEVHVWLSLLQTEIHANLQSTGESRTLAPAAFWYYYTNRRGLDPEEKDSEEERETEDKWAIVSPYP
jgi:hypothetical protein